MLLLFLYAIIAGFLAWCVSQLTNSAGFPAWLVFTLYSATLVFVFWYLSTVGLSL
jgi:hypothetical protein